MSFEEIVAGIATDCIVLAAPLGEIEEFVRCDDCGRLVRARPTAYRLHTKLTCKLYQEAGQ